MLRYDFEGEDFAKQIRAAVSSTETEGAEAELRAFLRRDTIGHDHNVKTPFGVRRVVYTDFTASGRALGCIEKYIQEQVLPFYGNTHTLSTSTARQSTYFRNEARQIIKHYLNATHEDALIFGASGTTGAVHKFVEILCRSNWTLTALDDVQGGANVSDGFLKEDRWGSYECTLCNMRMKTEAVYRAHRYTDMHQSKLQDRQAKNPFEGTRRVVILCDPVAHHSSLLPFRELTRRYVHAATEPIFQDSMHSTGGTTDPSNVEIEVCTLRLDPATCMLDEVDLLERLRAVHVRKGASAICMLSAGSNVTGLLADVAGITSLIHQFGGLACWDYAATAGHLRPDLNPPARPDARVDAAFFSPHKLIGGPGTVGLLVAKKWLLRNAVPAIPGGGVVFFVDPKGHSYIQNAEDREEAGTPSIVDCIRTGLVYHLHQLLPEAVFSAEERLFQMLLKRLNSHSHIDLLGPTDGTQRRAGILSFMIRYGNKPGGGLYLHYNYVVALLNDLFGIQARGGCACAGPYGQMLLGIDNALASVFDEALAKSAQEVFRPGFVRVGVHFTMADEELETLASAIEWIADKGWRLLPAYSFCVETGEWQHRLAAPQQDRQWLSAFVPPVLRGSLLRELESSINAAKDQVLPDDLNVAADTATVAAFKGENPIPLASTRCPTLDADNAQLLWFALPTDSAAALQSGATEPGLCADGAIFSEPGVQRPEDSIFSVRKFQSGEEITDSPTAALATDENNVASTDDALDTDLIPGEWGCDDADDTGSGTDQPVKHNFPVEALHPKIPKPMRHHVAGAIKEFNMIREGDRLLVGLSGGKDSLTMLHVLLELQRRSPVKFTVAAATVNPETPEYSPQPLIDYMKALGVEYHFLCKPLIEMAKTHLDPKKPSICSFCARMKRGMLYTCMRENGFNVLCLGQHLDDFAESFLMSAFRNGALRTMKANYYVEAGDVRVCRPLVNVREKMMAQFAKENHLPIIADNCPACFAAPKERHRIKLMLSQQEFEHPDLFWSLLKTMNPLLAIDKTERSLDFFRRAACGGDDLDGDGDEPISSQKTKPENSDVAEACTGVPRTPPNQSDGAVAARTAAAMAAGALAGSFVTAAVAIFIVRSKHCR